MKHPKRQHILAKVDAFPTIPGGAAKLLSLLRDPETAVSQVEAVLRNDPGLTANVLKLTNSACFGFASKIGSVRQAVVMLGAKRLMRLVMASCSHSVMNRSVEGYELSTGALWRHAIAVSVAAEALIEEFNLPCADVIFTAALLHDIGKLALGEFVKDEMKEIEDRAAEGMSFEAAEQSVLGTNHAEIGALILKQWSLPSDIVAAVRWHHEPEACPQPGLTVEVVHVADVLSLMIGMGVGREGLQYRPSTLAAAKLGLKPLQLEAIASRTLQSVSELSEVFESQ